MNDYKVIKKIVLSPKHEPTGKTKHFRTLDVDSSLDRLSLERTEIQAPHSLEIIQFENDVVYYLIYKDEFDQELIDTYHETLESAFKQAKWEFNVETGDWIS